MGELTNDDAMKLTLEEMIEGIQIITFDWRYLFLNAAATKQGRGAKSNLIGHTMMECYPGIETTPMFQDLAQVMRTRSPLRRENEFEYNDETKCWFELFIEPHSRGILIRSIDITDRKQLENKLKHAQRLEAMGLLAGSIAHDFNNKLSIMLAFSEILLELLDPTNEETVNCANKIIKAIDESAALTKQLLAFSRKQVLTQKVLDLNEYLLQAKQGLETLIGKGITMDYRLAPDLGRVRLDPTQLDQVILNLCANARDAMAGRGTLMLNTENIDVDDSFTESHQKITPGRYVMVAVCDTGCGMSKETLSKIFEPFFTTKEQHKGTGLGLSTVHGIVNQSRGHIWVSSEIGKGTEFKVYFPHTDEELTREFEALNRLRPSVTTAVVLLVEDDITLREALKKSMERAGYVVHAVGCAVEAEKLFMNKQASVNFLLTDVVLPGLDGCELAKKLMRLNAELKVIFMSGYAEHSHLQQETLNQAHAILEKPFTMHDLQEAVSKAAF